MEYRKWGNATSLLCAHNSTVHSQSNMSKTNNHSAAVTASAELTEIAKQLGVPRPETYEKQINSNNTNTQTMNTIFSNISLNILT